MNFIKRRIKYYINKKISKMTHTVMRVIVLLCLVSILTGCTRRNEDVGNVNLSTTEVNTEQILVSTEEIYGDDLEYYESVNPEESDNFDCNIPEYSGVLSVIINNNIPQIDINDADNGYFIQLSELDDLGRCGVAYMCVDYDNLPTEEREEIGHIKPSGWHTVKYPEQIADLYLYNRCHLLMYALSGLNGDERNLITGTRQLNADMNGGMLYYEDMVLDYVKETKNHVLYRVTPIFDGDNLVAKGVQMEALSVEDNTICFNVFIYNVQDGIEIDYKTGESWIKNEDSLPNAENEDIEYISDDIIVDEKTEELPNVENDSLEGLQDTENVEYMEYKYILNTNTMKVHNVGCDSVNDIAKHNKMECNDDIDTLIEKGYTKCKRCF